VSSRASRRALDFVSVALVALGLAPPGLHALGPAVFAVALQALVRRREGRSFVASLVALGALIGSAVHSLSDRPDAVSEAMTFAGLAALLVAVIFGPSPGGALAASLAASCRRDARLRGVSRPPTLRPARRATTRPAGSSS
jgi:apolipoprotein N-acyltransferase